MITCRKDRTGLCGVGRRSVTLAETLVAGVLIGLVLLIAALGIEQMRGEMKREQVVELLSTLNRAALAYKAETGKWPALKPSEVPPGGSRNEYGIGRDQPQQIKIRNASDARPSIEGSAASQPQSPDVDFAWDDGTTEQVLALLHSVPASAEILSEISAVLRMTEEASDEPGAAPAHWVSVRDAWGRPLRTLTTGSARSVEREAVVANNGCPVFISAGPDGRFGRTEHAMGADNLRSDELPRTPFEMANSSTQTRD